MWSKKCGPRGGVIEDDFAQCLPHSPRTNILLTTTAKGHRLYDEANGCARERDVLQTWYRSIIRLHSPQSPASDNEKSQNVAQKPPFKTSSTDRRPGTLSESPTYRTASCHQPRPSLDKPYRSLGATRANLAQRVLRGEQDATEEEINRFPATEKVRRKC
ncbi:MAG: hypothetical protein Q9180_002969 [Flavoplaca navasiana]